MRKPMWPGCSSIPLEAMAMAMETIMLHLICLNVAVLLIAPWSEAATPVAMMMSVLGLCHWAPQDTINVIVMVMMMMILLLPSASSEYALMAIGRWRFRIAGWRCRMALLASGPEHFRCFYGKFIFTVKIDLH